MADITITIEDDGIDIGVGSQGEQMPAVTQVEAEAGTGTGLRAWSPLRIAQAIAALAAAAYAAITHAEAHATGGDDELTPAAIGASPAGHDHDDAYEAAGAAAEVGAALLLHAGDTGNPHGVTLEQVGAQPAMTAASQAEMEAGTEEALRSMSPLLVAQAIEALGSSVGGAVLQVVTARDSTSYSVYNAVIPIDGSIPQISEGTDYPELAVTITPKAATSKIVLRYTLAVAASNANATTIVLAVFRDADGDAVYATVHHIAQSTYATISVEMVLAAGSTAARTYRLRTGEPNGSRYHYRNRTPGVDNHFGGAEECSVVAMEVAG